MFSDESALVDSIVITHSHRTTHNQASHTLLLKVDMRVLVNCLRYVRVVIAIAGWVYSSA